MHRGEEGWRKDELECLVHAANEKRVQSVQTFVVLTILQVLGLFVSHRLVQYKSDMAEKLERIAAVASIPRCNLDPGLSYHFFLR